jgi:hypothetical protein
MRMRILSAPSVLLLLNFLPIPATAQSNPASPGAPQESFSNPSVPTERTDTQKKPTNLPPLPSRLYFFNQGIPALLLQRRPPLPEGARCAHIIILPAPKIDSEMVVEAPPGLGGNITTFRGFPPCCDDVLEALRFQGLPGATPFPWRGPSGKPPFVKPPSVQPKPTEAPNPKP